MVEEAQASSESADWQKTVTYQLTDELVLASQGHLMGIWNLCKILIIFLTPSVFIVWAFLRNNPNTLRGALIVLTIFTLMCIAYYLFSYVRTRKSTLSVLNSMKHRTQKLTFSEDCLFAESPIGKSDMKWNLITQLRKFRDMWILTFANSMHFAIPHEYIDEQIGFFLEQKTIQNGGKILNS